ncbi:hypothetical protein LZ31DRAFT_298967 [Colletotrichum somersetense]|nr:hypothetical protein LZ31DRAFT_298967 [Colletotrichum somersetense]
MYLSLLGAPYIIHLYLLTYLIFWVSAIPPPRPPPFPSRTPSLHVSIHLATDTDPITTTATTAATALTLGTLCLIPPSLVSCLESYLFSLFPVASFKVDALSTRLHLPLPSPLAQVPSSLLSYDQDSSCPYKLSSFTNANPIPSLSTT